MIKMEKRTERKIDPSGKEMIDFVKMICEEVGPRIGGSEEEKKAGEIISNRMSSFCDEVVKDEFECHPKGFLDYIWVTAILYIIGVVLYFFIPWLSSIIIFLGIAVYFVQQNLTLEVIDFLFPKKDSFHVIGKIKPKGQAKKLVLLGGHHDSAYEFPLLSKLGGRSTYLIVSTLLVSILNIIIGFVKTILLLMSAASGIISIVDLVQIILFIIGVPLILIIAKFLRSNKVVMGANDNLTAVAAIIEIGKHFSKEQNRPKETEIWLVSFAGEEHMRGSKRFVAHYKEELKKRDAMLINLECLSADTFLLATAENMFFAKHSERVIEIIKKAAEDLDIDIEVGPLKFAGSDSANFSRKGLDAATLFGRIKKGTPADWHTLNDVPERLKGESIAKGTEIALHSVEIVDEK
ncbi:MAG: M20/M25/M40 family metallo-hydrolase [Candidatus Lokiarchaeota archaeon]|nr:M20/M25/M40 family metallo-hydrolase [Candidatus Lokiarchaeota archaeon]